MPTGTHGNFSARLFVEDHAHLEPTPERHAPAEFAICLRTCENFLMGSIGDVPLANDRNGEPVELPTTAAAFRVRRAAQHGKGGAPAVVWRDGQPLVCAIETDVETLRELVGDKPGLYRLDAVDESGRTLANVPACYCQLGDGGDDGRSDDPLSRVLASNERLARVNAEAMEKLGAQLSSLVEAAAKLVAAADGAGVTKREAATVAEIVEPLPEPQPSPWLPIVESLAPHVPQLVQAGVALLATRSAASTTPQLATTASDIIKH